MRKFKETWESLDQRVIPSWYQQAKFGVFIHWGVYSVPSWRGINNELFGSYAEWYYASVYGNYRNHDPRFHENHYGKDFKYRDFAKWFKAELFDADKWANLFKESGAKYVVLTTKHHDGYCLWPTENKHKKNWRVTDVGPSIDIVGELTKSVNKHDMKMGFYYSIIDWETNRSHRVDWQHFIPEKDAQEFGIDEETYPDEILIPQLKELVTTYHPELIFSDGGEWDLSEEYSKTKEILAWLYNESSVKETIVVNDRFCKTMPSKHGDYYSTEYNDKEGFLDQHPWEESRGIGKSYGFNRAEALEDYHSFEEIIKTMINIISKGGNFLLNVGPTADGRIPVIQEERLKQIGRWMKINSDSIYDTKSGYQEVINYPSTKKERNQYVFIDNVKNKIEIEFTNKVDIQKIDILGINEEILFKWRGNILEVEIPMITIYEFLLKSSIDFETYVLRLELRK